MQKIILTTLFLIPFAFINRAEAGCVKYKAEGWKQNLKGQKLTSHIDGISAECGSAFYGFEGFSGKDFSAKYNFCHRDCKKGQKTDTTYVHIVSPKEIVKEGSFWKNIDNGKRTTCVKLDGDDLAYCWKKLKSEYERPYESMEWIWP